MRNPLRSLAARITLLVVLATVVSALTVSWISVQSLDGFLRQKLGQRFHEVAERVAQDVDEWYALRAREIDIFAGSAILADSAARLASRDGRGDRAREEASRSLRSALERFPHFDRLVIASGEGVPLLQVGVGDALPAGFLAVATPAASPSQIGDVQRLGRGLVQFASVPMRDANARPIARLYAMLDLAMLEPMLRSEALGETARVLLVDRDGRFLNPPEGVAPGATYGGSASALDEAQTVAYYEDPRGDRVVGSRTPFPRFGWTLVIEQPYDEAFAPIVSSMSRVAGLNLIIVLAVGLLAFRMAGSIVQPLRALSEAAQRLSNGEREVMIEEASHSTEEVHVLTRTFNEMSRGLGRNAQALEESQREIEAANQELLAKNEELSNMNLVLEQLSITDGLTKLHNHRYFQEAIAAECKRAARTGDPLCLALIDIDHFKKWNDRLGHAGGDEILRRLAEVLNQTCRETDLLARYGGEEFAILAIDTPLAGAIALGEKIRQAVESTAFVTDVPSERDQLTVSVGVAVFAGDRQRLFADADAALYAAKDAGRNQLIVARPASDGSGVELGALVEEEV